MFILWKEKIIKLDLGERERDNYIWYRNLVNFWNNMGKGKEL